MTPNTATAMSMGIGTTLSLSTPTVTGGGSPSDEPSEPQQDEQKRIDGNNERIVSCPDGDLLLNIRHQSNQDAEAETGALILSLQVSSTVLRIASAPLKLLLDAPPVSRSRTQSRLHHLIAIHEPRVWGYREGRGAVSLILKAPIQSEQLREAALIFFHVLHPNEESLPAGTPSMLQIAWVAELAWVLGYLRPLVPWIRSWLTGGPVVDADTRLVSALFLAFVMGDRETFEQASLHWILRGRKSDFDKFEGSSLGIMIVIHDALQRKRQEVAQGLIDILNGSLRSYYRSGKQPGNFDQTFILGAFFSAICDSSTGVTITPCSPIPNTGPPFHLQWQPQMNEESINSLLGKLLAITELFNVELQLHRRDLFSKWINPVPPLAAKVVTLRESLQGLNLVDYRPEVAGLMDVKSCLGNVAGEIEKELEQLRKYSVPPMNDLQCTWRIMAIFVFVLHLLSLIAS
ncbi:hypothetical protein EV426DRAFT_601703 [Tirmania nivea]|nr:hypothetical protein EV426DRAFT_601703 [Tirmania nivea]